MATEEEVREAADGKEVQVEAMDLEPFHMQTHLDSKLSSRESKNVAETINSTEGMLNIAEDQVSVNAHPEIKLPLEHNLNGTSSSLNGHKDEENKISNEQLHKYSKKDHEQEETALDGESTDQDNKINKEANDCSSHRETTTENSSLLKHENEEGPKGDDLRQDEDPMPDTLKTNSDIDESKLFVGQLDQNMDPAKATEDIQPASVENIPNAEVVTETCAEVLSPIYPNLDDSDAILDSVDGRTETYEVARKGGAIHLEHRESIPEDTSTAKRAEEVVKAEDQQSKQADAMDADAVPEDIAKCVLEEMSKFEHADESTIDAEEVLHQEPSEDTNDPACEKMEQTSQQSSMAASDDTTSEHDSTTCEPPGDIQVQNKKTLEEMKDADAFDTEAAMQERCVAFEEVNPKCHVATTENGSVGTIDTESTETHNVKTVPSSEEDKVENGVTERGPTTGSQEADNVESAEEIMDIIAENIVEITNVATVDEVDKEKNMLRAEDIAGKHMPVIESEVTKSTEPVETEEDSDQRHVSLLDDSAQGDNTPVSEKQDMESALERNEIEATRTEAVPEERGASVSEELSPEDYVRESETTSDAKEVDTTESLEVIEGNKDTKTREMPDQDNMCSAGDVQEVQELGLKEQTRGIEAMESEHHQQHGVCTLEETAVDNKQNVDDHQMHEEKPAELKDNEAMEAEPVLEQSNISSPDNAPEGRSELGNDPDCCVQQAQQVESSRDSEDSKLLKEGETSDQTIITPEDTATEDIVKDDIDTPVGMEQEHQQKSVKTSDVQKDQELSPTEQTRGIEATETEDHQQHRVSSLEEPAADKKHNVDDHQVHEEKPAELKDNEAMEAEPVLEQSNISSPDNAPEEKSELGNDPDCCVQPTQQVEPSRDSEDSKLLKEEETSDQTIITLEDTATEDIVEDETDTPVGMEQEHAQKSVETSVAQKDQELGPTEQTRGIEATETEDHQQHRVSTLEEPAVDKKQNVDDHQVHEEKPAELKDNESLEAEPVLEQSNISSPDNAPEEKGELGNDPDCCVQPAQQVEPSKNSEDSKLLKEEGTSDQTIITLEDTATKEIVEDETDTHVGMEQEHEQKLVKTSDVQKLEELYPTVQTRGIKATETEDHQQHRVSTLEEPAVDNKPNVDDHQVHDEQTAELKDNEAIEAEPVLEQSNISIPDNVIEERSEMGNDPNCCVQPAEQVESSKDTEDSKLLKEGDLEETSDKTIITLEDTATEDIVEDEIDPLVGMEQEHQQKSVEISDVQEVQEPDLTEETRGIEVTETEHHQQHRVSTLEEPAVDNKQNVDEHQMHEEKPAELKDNEAMEAEPALEQSNISPSDNAPEEKSELGNNPDCCVQPAQQVESSRDSEDSNLLKEGETSDQTIITLEDTATEDIVEDEIDPLVGMEQEHQQKSVEISDVQEVQELDSTEETRGIEATDTEHHQQHRVSTLEKPAVDKKQNVDDHQVHDEQTAELKDNEAIEAETVLEQSNISTPDNVLEERSELGNDPDCCVQPAQQVEPSRDSEDSKLLKEEETSDQTIITLEDIATKDIVENEINTPVRMEQEHGQKSLETYDVQKVQELGPTEQTRGIEATETEDHQQHRVSTLEELAVDKKPNVDDHQVHEEKPAIFKNNEAMEAEQVLEQSNISTPDNVPEERSELGNDPDCCVQPAQQVESSRDSEDSKLLNEEESSDQKLITLEDTATEDIVEDGIDPPVGMKQEHEQKVSLDEQHKEDEEVESQKEQIQADIQKHKDEADDVGNLPLIESKNTEIGTTNRTEETDTLEAGQTEAVVNEILMIEQALHNSEDSTPSVTEKDYSANTSDADAKMYKQEDQENKGKDNIVPMDSTSGRDEKTYEIINEELEPSLASSAQEISHTSPSKDHILENDPIAVPYNAESGGDEYKECTNKVNDDLLAIQEPEKEMVAGMQENKGMQNETKDVHHAESYTKAGEEEMSQLHSDEPYNVDTKIDDTTHSTTVQPREIEEIGGNKGLSSIYKPVAVVETSKQNNVEQDLSIHYKVEDEKLESTDDNAVELEATQEKVDTSNVDTNNDVQLSISNSFTKHEAESADDVLQLETEGNTCDKADETGSYEKTEASNTSVHEIVTFNEEICDMVTGTEGGLSDESLKTFDDTRRNLDVSSVVTESSEESMNKEMEEHKLAVPAHPTMVENTPKQDISVSDKPLPTEPEEQEDDQIHKERDEEDMHEPDFGDNQKEVEQDLPVSNFLMNLILGKENSDANVHSEPEAETKQEETTDDNSCLITHKQEENLVLPPTENNVEDKLVVEQEKKDIKYSEEKHEVVKEQCHDLKLGTEIPLETDADVNKNSHQLDLPPYQDKMQDEISNEILLEEAAEVFIKVEAKDIVIPNIKQDDREVDTVCQENTEAATQNEIESLKNNLDDLNNTKASEEETLGEGQTGLLPECLNDARSVNSVSEKTLLLTESGMTNAKSLPSEADSVPDPVFDIQDKTIESSSTRATSIPNIQVENEEDKTEEKQPTTTDTGEVAEEHMEISNDNSQKSIGPEATSNDQEPQITEQASDTEIDLGQEKEISAGSSSTFMDKKEDSNVPLKEGNTIQTAVKIQSDGSNMQINQDKQEAADNKTEMEKEKLEEYNIQEKQGNGTEEKSSKECHQEDQKFLVKRETVIKEGDAQETVKNHTETVKIKANDEQELSDPKVQERDLNVFPPKDGREPEESFVDTAKPKSSTDEEQGPKADESNMSEQKNYEGKTNVEEKIENFTDKAMQTEAQVAGQKAALKKHNLLSGVGSKVKRQLAKVKNAITGKPGHAKQESPKA